MTEPAHDRTEPVSLDDRYPDALGDDARILVAVERETDPRVTDAAIALAAEHDARVDALSVVPMSAPTDHWDMVVERREADAESALDALGAAGDAAGVTVEKHLRYGDPADEVVAAADAYDAALVVVGDPGRTGIRKLITPPSVTTRVSRDAPVPVLAVPAVGRPVLEPPADDGSVRAGSTA